MQQTRTASQSRIQTPIDGRGGVLAILLGLALAAMTAQAAGPPAAGANPPDSPLALQVPLDKTGPLRAQFATEFQTAPDTQLRALYDRWIDRIGANGIIATLDKVEPVCHEHGHALGAAIYARVGEVGRALATCAAACNSGCMHGVFRQALSGNGAAPAKPDPRTISARLEKACLKSGTYPLGDCIHGMGHAFMYLARYDVARAMGYCDQLKGQAKAFYCATGAYMELLANPPDGYLLAKSIYFPCNESPYPAACFRHRFGAGLLDFYQAGGTFRQLVGGCVALTGQARLGCFHGIGNGHFLLLVRSPERLAEICGAGEHDDQVVCVEGAIDRMARYTPDEAIRACKALSDWRAPVCNDARTRGMYSMDRSFALYGR